MLCVLPLFHIYALSAVFLLSIRRNCELVLHMRFDATRVLEDIARLKITNVSRGADDVDRDREPPRPDATTTSAR